MNKLSIILLILVILLGIGLAGALIYYNSMVYELSDDNNEQKSRLENLGTQILEKENEIKDLETEVSEYEDGIDAKVEYLTNFPEYKNDKIDVTFNYPKEWGDITATESDDGHGEGVVANTMINASAVNAGNGNFMYAVAKEPNSDRGGFWGDDAVQIKDQQYIDTYCIDKENCTVSTNPNGVKYAKHTTTVDSEGFTKENVDVYYIHNPSSDFHGIMLYSAWLEEAGVENAKEELAELVNTLAFEE